ETRQHATRTAAPPRPAPVQPRPVAPSFILPLKNAEAIDSVPPLAQPAQVPPSTPVLHLADAEPRSVSLRDISPPVTAPADDTRGVDDDDFIADQPPELPAAGE